MVYTVVPLPYLFSRMCIGKHYMPEPGENIILIAAM
jgi:hypothetical protein